MQDVLITNNPLVRDRFGGEWQVEYREIPIREILVLARDMVHKGHRLLTHPLSGSVKPGETPCKSLLLTGSTGPLDLRSLELAEQSIAACEKFSSKYSTIPPQILEDFRQVDLALIAGALSGRGRSQ